MNAWRRLVAMLGSDNPLLRVTRIAVVGTCAADPTVSIVTCSVSMRSAICSQGALGKLPLLGSAQLQAEASGKPSRRNSRE